MAGNIDQYNIKMAALGRQIQLGELLLYDYRNDRIVKGTRQNSQNIFKNFINF